MFKCLFPQQFAVTLVIPSVPPDNTTQDNFQDVWYGVGQSGFPRYLGHIIDEDNGPPSNEWDFLPIYCCE